MESEDFPSEKRRCFIGPRVEILRLDFSRLGRPARSQPIEDRNTESALVVKRLLAIVREHRASARRIGSPLDPDDLGKIVDALRVEAFGGDPHPLLHHKDPVAAWLRHSLFQELLEEPSKVLFTTHIDDETVRYVAMDAAFWRECLAELGEQLSRG